VVRVSGQGLSTRTQLMALYCVVFCVACVLDSDLRRPQRIESQERVWSVYDTPGRPQYAKNALVGMANADVGLLVVAAAAGEFEAGFSKDGATRQLSSVALPTGLTSIVVAVTKMDTAGAIVGSQRLWLVQKWRPSTVKSALVSGSCPTPPSSFLPQVTARRGTTRSAPTSLHGSAGWVCWRPASSLCQCVAGWGTT
jgi:hypothetical protein